MSMKKKLASKLANGVRQVKLQREQTPATPATSAKTASTAPVVKPVAKPVPVSVTTRPAAPRTAQQQPVTNLDKLHPQRIRPD